jgi:hypothetical protein
VSGRRGKSKSGRRGKSKSGRGNRRERESESEEDDSDNSKRESTSDEDDDPEEGDGSEEIEPGGKDVVEHTLDHKVTKGKGKLYWVKWRGCGEHENTWEPVVQQVGDAGVSREFVRDNENQLAEGKLPPSLPPARQPHHPSPSQPQVPRHHRYQLSRSAASRPWRKTRRKWSG